MSNKIKPVIPKPCQENWLELNAEEKIRFCTLCQQNVFDATDENKHNGDSCLRYSSLIANKNEQTIKFNIVRRILKFLIRKK